MIRACNSSSLILLATLSFASPATADSMCTDAGRRGAECPPFETCSVYRGDCGSAKAPLSVCTGRCEAGGSSRFVPRFGGFASSGEDDTDVGALLGLEIVLPPLRGHVSARAEWWIGSGARFGPVFSLSLGDMLRASASVDAIRIGSAGGIGTGARLEYFPWHLAPGLIPFQFGSLWFEASAAFLSDNFDDRLDRLSAGIGVWL